MSLNESPWRLAARALLVVLAFSGQAAAQESEWPTPSEDDLRKIVTGATLTGEIKAEPPFNFTEYLSPDGKSRGKMIECCKPQDVATKGLAYEGDWKVEQDNLCVTYEGEERKICWRLEIKGDRFRMIDEKAGQIGEGQIRSGNPDNL